jgi:hypothetical protein
MSGKDTEPTKMGAPSKYDVTFNDLAEKLCAKFGADDKKLAEFFEVTEQTINNWKKDHPDFFESIKSGKDIHNSKKAELSLVKRVEGFEYEEVHTEITEEWKPDKEGVEHLVGKKKHVKKVKKYYPPDPLSIFYWCNNRMSKRWKNVKSVYVQSTSNEGQDIKPYSIFKKKHGVKDDKSKAKGKKGKG